MNSFKKLAKLSSFLIPAGGFAYLTNQLYFGNTQHVHTYVDNEVVGYFKQYVEDNNLVSPHLYKNYQKKYKFDHFFEKGVLKDIEGLAGYNIFLDKAFNDVLNDEAELSQEEKKNLLSKAKVHCTFAPNYKLQGHKGIVHGGFTSTLFDNVSGCLAFMACDFTPAVTAYLNVNYNKPMTIDTEYVAVIEVEKIEGRKVFLKGKIVDKDNNVYTTMDTLYIKMKWDNSYLKHLYKSLLLDKKLFGVGQAAKEKVDTSLVQVQ
jgi:acyl-coenzyme A thioesterase PaaI-like protein